MLLTNRSALHKRIADAYPNVIYKTEKITKKMQKMKSEMERLKDEASMHIEEMEDRLQEKKQNISSLLETSSELKDDIIMKQEELINMMENGMKDEQRIKSIRTEIELRKKQLENRIKRF